MDKRNNSFRKEVKMALLKRDMSTGELVTRLNKETGMHYDAQYLAKVFDGRRRSYPVITAVCKMLELDMPESYYGA